MSIVDGAHAPGQLHLDLERYGVDVYLGNKKTYVVRILAVLKYAIC